MRNPFLILQTLVSEHAKSSSREYFAEFFAYWCSSNTRALALLKELTPETYAYFEGLTKVQKELLVQMQKNSFLRGGKIRNHESVRRKLPQKRENIQPSSKVAAARAPFHAVIEIPRESQKR